MQQKITILLTDDHPLIRAGVRAMLNEAGDMQVIGEAENGAQAMELIPQLLPKVHLLDLKMPGISAAELERWMRAHYPAIVTLTLSGHNRDFYLAEMMSAGVSGCLSKTERGEKLLEAIRKAARGESLFTEEEIQRARLWRERHGRKWHSLTPREREVAALLVKGLADADLAKTLSISVRTASTHVKHLLDKLEVKSRQEATAWLVKHIPSMSE